MVQLLKQGGLEFFNNCVFELKWKPENEAESSEEEPAKKAENEKPTHEETSKLRNIVIDFEITNREWLL